MPKTTRAYGKRCRITPCVDINTFIVYMIQSFMRLTRDEAFAIRYHMGFSGNEDKNSVGRALEMFPLALAVNVADMEATYYLEGSVK